MTDNTVAAVQTAHTDHAQVTAATVGERAGFLRLALKLDAAATGALGVLMLAAGPWLAGLLGLPASIPGPLGAFLAVYAVAILVIGTRQRINRAAVWVAVVLNLLWVVDSVALVVLDWYPLTGLGVAFVLAQAVAVLVFVDLQYVGLRRSRPGAA